MPSLIDLADVLTSLRVAVPNGFDGDVPGLVVALLGIGAWLRWAVIGVRRALQD